MPLFTSDSAEAYFFNKFEHENVIQMKNKPAPTLLQPSYLSNVIIKGYQNLAILSL
jgi:hypothetical protein